MEEVDKLYCNQVQFLKMYLIRDYHVYKHLFIFVCKCFFKNKIHLVTLEQIGLYIFHKQKETEKDDGLLLVY